VTGTKSQIQLTHVTKAYGSHVVLSECNLNIWGGEFVVVIGRSGSGKSTLLNLIGGLDRPTNGEITILENSLTDISEDELSKLRCQKLGFVFQFFNLIPTLTVAENIRLPMALNNPKTGHTERVTNLLNELGLPDCGHRFPEELSGGEQQRVAIARALAHKPDIVLADEPTGNLDLDTAKEVLSLLTQTCRRYNATLIMATHSQEVIGSADRVLTIRSSHLEEQKWPFRRKRPRE
jgi:putative ABC transport system ATP-binding protein